MSVGARPVPLSKVIADLTYQPLDSDLTTWAGITPGTGVGTALAVSVGSAGAFMVLGGAGGTPSSINLANATSTPAASLTGTIADARNTVSNSTTTGMTALTTIGAAGAGTVNIPYTTSASSATTGSLKIGNGTAATNVGIGGGNINAGGSITGASLALGNGAITCGGITSSSYLTAGSTAGLQIATKGLFVTTGTDGSFLASTVGLTDAAVRIQLGGTSAAQSNSFPSIARAASSTQIDFLQGASTSTWVDIKAANGTLTGALAVTGSSTLGGGTSIKNIRFGISGAMVIGAVTITDTAATASTRYLFSCAALGTVAIAGTYSPTARSNGASVTCTSSQATETSTIYWLAFEP